MTTHGNWLKPLEIEIDLDEWGTKSKVIVAGVDISDNVYRLEIEARPQYLTSVTLELRQVRVHGRAKGVAKDNAEGD